MRGKDESVYVGVSKGTIENLGRPYEIGVPKTRTRETDLTRRGSMGVLNEKI